MDTPRVYIASLSDYNAGVLHGCWVDVTTPDEMLEQIHGMLAESPTAKQEGCPAEEWAIHDYEGFGELRLSEYEGLDRLCEMVEGIEEHGEPFLSWAANNPTDNHRAEDFEQVYRGEWDSLADYVQDWFEQSGDRFEAPAGCWFHPANYIDWDRMGHDLELNGEVWTAPAPGGKVWVFENR